MLSVRVGVGLNKRVGARTAKRERHGWILGLILVLTSVLTSGMSGLPSLTFLPCDMPGRGSFDEHEVDIGGPMSNPKLRLLSDSEIDKHHETLDALARAHQDALSHSANAAHKMRDRLQKVAHAAHEHDRYLKRAAPEMVYTALYHALANFPGLEDADKRKRVARDRRLFKKAYDAAVNDDVWIHQDEGQREVEEAMNRVLGKATRR